MECSLADPPHRDHWGVPQISGTGQPSAQCSLGPQLLEQKKFNKINPMIDQFSQTV